MEFSMDQDKIKARLAEANRLYRLGEGESPLSDEEYDYLLSLVDDEALKNQVGIEIDKNKIELAVPMGSLNKVKTRAELLSWFESKQISLQTNLTVSPKFDGLSLLVEFEDGRFKSAATRGDGAVGQNVTEHFRLTRLGKLQLKDNFTGFVVGETIMPEERFAEKYASKFKNPRNMVAGLLSRKTISEELLDVDFIAFSVDGKDFASTAEELAYCNNQINWIYDYQLTIRTLSLADVQEDTMMAYFKEETVYQCDGLVVEVDEVALQNELGRETNSLNPAFARAWKPESDDSRSSQVTGVTWQVSKSGSQKPVVQIEPIELGGVTISNVTGINAKFIKESKIAAGALVSVIRSGDVIPKIINVLVEAEGEVLPTECSSCQGPLIWDKNEVDQVCVNPYCAEKVVSEMAEFFKIMDIDEVGEGIVRQVYEGGYQDVESILKMSAMDFLKLEGFKEKKAHKVYKSIHDKLSDVSLAKLQHASNLFKSLGSRKLELLTEFDSVDKKPTLEQILAIDGYSDITANAYLAVIDEFWLWCEKLPISIKSYEAPQEGSLTGKTFVFSGYRSKEAQAEIEAKGGKIGSSVSKKSFALVLKAKGSGSSKEKKAVDLGIEVFNPEELSQFLEAN